MADYKNGEKLISVCNCRDKQVPSTLTSETISLCEGLKEVKNVLIRICDECGNMCSIPYQSLRPVHKMIKILIGSKVISDPDDVTIELKSIVERERNSIKPHKISKKNAHRLLRNKVDFYTVARI